MTPEEHAKVVMEAIDKTHKKNMESKEEARAFLRRAGIIQDDKTEPINNSDKKNSK